MFGKWGGQEIGLPFSIQIIRNKGIRWLLHSLNEMSGEVTLLLRRTFELRRV
jgi:hypothetical protein